MSRTSIVIVAVFICAAFLAEVHCRNLALTGGISSVFNTPFRVIGKRNQMYALYDRARFNANRYPSLSLEQQDY